MTPPCILGTSPKYYSQRLLPKVFYRTPPSIVLGDFPQEYSTGLLLVFLGLLLCQVLFLGTYIPIEYCSRGLLPKYYSQGLLPVPSIRRASPWKSIIKDFSSLRSGRPYCSTFCFSF